MPLDTLVQMKMLTVPFVSRLMAIACQSSVSEVWKGALKYTYIHEGKKRSQCTLKYLLAKRSRRDCTASLGARLCRSGLMRSSARSSRQRLSRTKRAIDFR